MVIHEATVTASNDCDNADHDSLLAALERRLADCIEDVGSLKRKQDQLARRHDDADAKRQGQLQCLTERVFEVEKRLKRSEDEKLDAIDKANVAFQKQYTEMQQVQHNLACSIEQVNENFDRLWQQLEDARLSVAHVQQGLSTVSNETCQHRASLALLQQGLQAVQAQGDQLCDILASQEEHNRAKVAQLDADTLVGVYQRGGDHQAHAEHYGEYGGRHGAHVHPSSVQYDADAVPGVYSRSGESNAYVDQMEEALRAQRPPDSSWRRGQRSRSDVSLDSEVPRSTGASDFLRGSLRSWMPEQHGDERLLGAQWTSPMESPCADGVTAVPILRHFNSPLVPDDAHGGVMDSDHLGYVSSAPYHPRQSAARASSGIPGDEGARRR